MLIRQQVISHLASILVPHRCDASKDDSRRVIIASGLAVAACAIEDCNRCSSRGDVTVAEKLSFAPVDVAWLTPTH